MADNYDDYSREELLRELRLRDRRPRFGLVWERKEIDHEKAVNDDFVMLDFDPALSCGVAPYRNLIIEGDNFDALRYLRMTHAGKIKCIYIDPPYNTGNRDFIYNDRFVDKDDAYRHSKWLEFMYRRLQLARDLLTEDGVIFVSIGEEEQAPLTLLMDQVFAGMKMGTFVWRRRSGAQDAKERFQSVDHEYVLAYGMPGFRFGGTAKNVEAYTNPDSDPRGAWNNDNLIQGKTMKQRPDAFYPVRNPELDIWYPCDSDNVWRFASKTRLNGKKIRTKPLEDLIDEGRVLWPKDEKPVVYNTQEDLLTAIAEGSSPRNLRVYLLLEELKAQVERNETPEKLLDNIPPLDFWLGKSIGFGKPRYKRFWSELKHAEKPVSSWILPASSKSDELEGADFSDVDTLTTGYTSEGTTLLAQILGNKDFPYPKPMSLIKNLITQATSADDLIMDFFAGSGTTGQVVLTLNAEDESSNRRFILVSSTEATQDESDKNVCRDITQRRLRSVIEGYEFRTPKGVKTVEGLDGNFAYLRTRRLPAETLFNCIQHEAIWTALQLIHAESLSPFIADALIQQAVLENSTVVYLPNINERTLQCLHDACTTAATLIVYTWQPGLLRQHFDDDRLSFLPIPQFLVDRFGIGSKA
ncbi:MAG: site-specific DNA-methyltransferase [Methylococcaceae bacterium]